MEIEMFCRGNTTPGVTSSDCELAAMLWGMAGGPGSWYYQTIRDLMLSGY